MVKHVNQVKETKLVLGFSLYVYCYLYTFLLASVLPFILFLLSAPR